MKNPERLLPYLLLVSLLLTVPAHAQDKNPGVELKLEKDRFVLYETVTGTVANLEPLENFTVSLNDAFGRVLIAQNVKRVGAKPTPFSFRIDFAPTIYCTVNVVSTRDRKAFLPVMVSPAKSSVWDDFPIMIWEDAADRGPFYFGAARLLGLNVDCVGPASNPLELLRANFQSLVQPVLVQPPFNPTPDAQEPEAPAHNPRAPRPAGPGTDCGLWHKRAPRVLPQRKLQ